MNPSNSSAPARHRVAFQGELGAYSYEALRAFFGDTAEPVPCRDFDTVGRNVLSGTVTFGLLPIENSLAGSVIPSYDVLGSRDLEVVGEVVSPIHHCLLALPGAGLGRLRRVLSHPVALAQCTRFFGDHPDLEAVSHYDTAGAAKAVADGGDPSQGSIAGRLAGELYGLEILAAEIEDRSDNQTRFLVVRPAGAEGPQPAWGSGAGERFRTSLLAETPNTPGALVRLLLPFAEAGVNLSKLESRPGDEPWSYRFFMDLDGAVGDPAVQTAVEAAREQSTNLRILGSYPRWRRP